SPISNEAFAPKPPDETVLARSNRTRSAAFGLLLLARDGPDPAGHRTGVSRPPPSETGGIESGPPLAENGGVAHTPRARGGDGLRGALPERRKSRESGHLPCRAGRVARRFRRAPARVREELEGCTPNARRRKPRLDALPR